MRSTDEAPFADVLERVLDRGVVIIDDAHVVSVSPGRHPPRGRIEHANIDAGPFADPADE